ncbi:hypothetical protein [Streptomyces sp. SLBN-31]|uniref:hypothetical protein n=1 Tax=Streptomyces sp. SLBN-31 TaxID=2768444 RepID=UPI0021B1BFFE|nr:hypothetical protein [Streptomyces sp. SLBN-31]
MRALTVPPGHCCSLDIPDLANPGNACGELLVRVVALGVRGTGREIAPGQYG